MALVSIVIPTYNQVAFLPLAIQSALAQTYSPLEVVVVNDGSRDNSQEILDQLALKEPRLRVFHQANQGFAVATNRAIAEARGVYIAHLDSDDLLEPTKIEEQLATLQTHPEVDLVHTALKVIDHTGKELMEMRSQDEDPDTFLAKMLFRSIMPNPTTIFGKKADLITVPYQEKYKRSVDYDRALRLAEKFRFRYLDRPLTYWRRHPGNLTNELEKYRAEQLDILRSFGTEKLMHLAGKAHLKKEEILLLKGNILYNIEHYADALGYFQQLKSATGYFYLANCYLKLNQADLAAEFPFSSGISVSRERSDVAFCDEGIALAIAEEKNAVDDLLAGDRKLIEKVNSADLAIQCYHQCLQLNPHHAACWNNLGVATQDKTCFERALELRPGYLDAQYNLTHAAERLTERELREVLIPYNLQAVNDAR